MTCTTQTLSLLLNCFNSHLGPFQSIVAFVGNEDNLESSIDLAGIPTPITFSNDEDALGREDKETTLVVCLSPCSTSLGLTWLMAEYLLPVMTVLRLDSDVYSYSCGKGGDSLFEIKEHYSVKGETYFSQTVLQWGEKGEFF